MGEENMLKDQSETLLLHFLLPSSLRIQVENHYDIYSKDIIKDSTSEYIDSIYINTLRTGRKGCSLELLIS